MCLVQDRGLGDSTGVNGQHGSVSGISHDRKEGGRKGKNHATGGCEIGGFIQRGTRAMHGDVRDSGVSPGSVWVFVCYFGRGFRVERRRRLSPRSRRKAAAKSKAFC